MYSLEEQSIALSLTCNTFESHMHAIIALSMHEVRTIKNRSPVSVGNQLLLI